MDLTFLIKVTGVLAGISLAFNFLTCCALPFSKEHCPWRGDRPGPDKDDYKGFYRNLLSYHKIFVYSTIFFVGAHVLLAVLKS